MNKLILLILSLVMLGCKTANIPKETTMEKLQKYKWKAVMNESSKDVICEVYQKDLMECRMFIEKGEFYCTVPFYLSDSIDSHFDKKKVGKNKNGKYTVEDMGGPMSVDKILELNDSVMIIQKYPDYPIRTYIAEPKTAKFLKDEKLK